MAFLVNEEVEEEGINSATAIAAEKKTTRNSVQSTSELGKKGERRVWRKEEEEDRGKEKKGKWSLWFWRDNILDQSVDFGNVGIRP